MSTLVRGADWLVPRCLYGRHGSIVPDSLILKVASEGITVFCLIDMRMFNISSAMSMFFPMFLNIWINLEEKGSLHRKKNAEDLRVALSEGMVTLRSDGKQDVYGRGSACRGQHRVIARYVNFVCISLPSIGIRY